jgi:hypothetical protein
MAWDTSSSICLLMALLSIKKIENNHNKKAPGTAPRAYFLCKNIKKFQIIFAKPLDKVPLLWYNTDTKGGQGHGKKTK